MIVVGLIFGGIVAGLVFGVLTIPTGFVPPEDKGALFVNIQLPDAASVTRTNLSSLVLSKKSLSGIDRAYQIPGAGLSAVTPNGLFNIGKLGYI